MLLCGSTLHCMPGLCVHSMLMLHLCCSPLACSVAFRWLLNDHEYVPHQELVHIRASVVQVSSRVIGVMSRIKLADVTAAFGQKMEERVSARKEPAPRADVNLLRTQALKLCAGGCTCGSIWGEDAKAEAQGSATTAA